MATAAGRRHRICHGFKGSDHGRNVGLDHLRRVDHAVEFRLTDEAEGEGRLLQRQILLHRVVGDLRRLVVADDRRERRYQHQRALDVFGDLLAVRLRAFYEELAEVVQPSVSRVTDRVIFAIINGL